MAFRSSKQARVYVGSLAAAAYARSASTSGAAEMLEVTTLADADKAFVPGLASSTFSVDGPLDSDGSAGSQFATIAGLQQAANATVVTYMPLGTDGAAWLIESHQTDFETMASVSGTVDWSMQAQTTGISDIDGVILENNTTVTTDTDGTANTGPVGGTANGAVFHLHVTAFSGLTSDDIIVEGSTSGAFAGEETTVATFTQVTDVTSERVAVTGTVPRYLRVVDDVTGTGSVTRLVAASRR